jgi:Tfp pilus assembly protein PilW
VSSESGFTFVELLVASAIAVAMTGAMIELARAAQAASAIVSDAADVQQKMRVAAEAIQHDLSMAGAGSALPSGGGPLAQFVPAVRPAVGIAGDSDLTFAADRVTVLYMPATGADADVVSATSAALSIGGTPSCTRSATCGFQDGMRAIVVDRGAPGRGYDVFTVADASAGSLTRKSDEGSFSTMYTSTGHVAEVVAHSYYLDRSDASNVRLMRGDGRSAFALVDGVRDLRFTYYADPDPSSAPTIGAASGSCVYDSGPPPRPLLAPLPGVSLSELSAADLTDGPFCGSPPNRFDADLLRVRRVGVSLQIVPVSSSASRQSSAFELSFDVTPHNLNVAR